MFASVLIAFIAAIHAYLMYAEMFRWPRIARMMTDFEPPVIEQTRALGLNQGLYNGFLAAGLFLTLVLDGLGQTAQVFFLVCVIVAGIVGWQSLGRIIPLYAQTLPAAVALIVLLLN